MHKIFLGALCVLIMSATAGCGSLGLAGVPARPASSLSRSLSRHISVQIFPLPSPNPDPVSIAAGPDGNMWFTGFNGYIGRISDVGSITLYTLSNSIAFPLGIAAGPDGNVWWAEEQGGIGRITPQGQITEFPIPFCTGPQYITSGPFEELWFTEGACAGQLGSLTTLGKFHQYPINTGTIFNYISAQGTSELWFVSLSEGEPTIARYTPATHQLRTLNTVDKSVQIIGPVVTTDNAVWYCESNYDKMVRIDRSGNSKSFPIQTNSQALAIAAGRAGEVWIGSFTGALDRMDAGGHYVTYPVGSPGTYISSIAPGPEGEVVWFVERTQSAIGRLAY